MDDEQANDEAMQEQEIPEQESATDTSNWDDRVFLAPDGKEHIKDLDFDTK